MKTSTFAAGVLLFLSSCSLCTRSVAGKDESNNNDCDTKICPGDIVDPRIDPELNQYEQDDERLIQILRRDYLVPPDPKKKLFLSQPMSSGKLGGQYGQAYEVDEMYK